MPLSILPKGYSSDFSQPNVAPVGNVEIDWSNPMTEGLVYYMLPKPTGHIEVASNEQPNGGHAGNFLLQDSIYREFGASHGSIQGQEFSVQNKLEGSDAFTLITKIRQISAATSSAVRIDGTLSLQTTGSSFRLAAWTPTLQLINFGAVASDGTVVTLSAHWVTGSTIKTYSDGVFNNESSTQSGTLSVTAGKPLMIGAAENNTERSLNGIGTTLIFARKLSDGERISLEADPYQLLKPTNPPLYFTKLGAAPAVFIPNVIQHLRNQGLI